MKKIRPLRDQIIVKIVFQKRAGGGLILPNWAEKKEAEVVAVGPGKRRSDGQRNPIDVAIGDRIMVQPHAGVPFTFEGQNLVMILADQVVGVLS